MVKTASYPTPQDAEAAFYEALESADLDAMMQVWADDEEIVCMVFMYVWPGMTLWLPAYLYGGG